VPASGERGTDYTHTRLLLFEVEFRREVQEGEDTYNYDSAYESEVQGD
jgi:hypothetical protein